MQRDSLLGGLGRRIGITAGDGLMIAVDDRQGAGRLVVGRKILKLGDETVHIVPVADFREHLGQCQIARQIIGELLHKTQILPDAFPVIAQLAMHRCKCAARLAMFPVQLEDVPKLDDRAIKIARFDQFQRGLIMPFGAILGVVTRGQNEHAGDATKNEKQFTDRIAEKCHKLKSLPINAPPLK